MEKVKNETENIWRGRKKFAEAGKNLLRQKTYGGRKCKERQKTQGLAGKQIERKKTFAEAENVRRGRKHEKD